MEFDYYIFIDYSTNLIGYDIIERKKLKDLLPRISKFAHYRELKYKRQYVKSIKKIIKKEKIINFLLKIKIKELRKNLEIYSDILNFIRNHEKCIIFISVDDHEYNNFKKLVKVVNGEETKIVQESKLKKGTLEYNLSLIIDTLLNIERLKIQGKNVRQSY